MIIPPVPGTIIFVTNDTTHKFLKLFFFQKFKDIGLEPFLNFEYYVQKSLTDDKND